MGLGKYLFGGVCAVGAVIAAPVALPAAGLAIAGSAVTGLAGVTVGTGIMAAGATTAAAATAGVVAGVAGVTAGALQEKKIDDSYTKGKKEGIVEASAEYEEKLKKQANAFYLKEKDLMNDKADYEQLISDMEDYIHELENQLNIRENKSEILESIADTKAELFHLKSLAA